MKKGIGSSSAVILALLILVCAAVPVQATMISWAQWTSKTDGNPGAAEGVFILPSVGNVNVTYTGELFSASDQGNWDQYPGTYTAPGVVDNQPSPATISIQLRGGNSTLNKIVFSTPLVDPVFAIQSLGSGGDGAEYVFNESFTILSQGPGHWGGSSTSLSQSGNSLIGYEGNGILQFSGTLSLISWTVPDGENYHMFTVGSSASAVPEPTTMILFGVGLVGIAGLGRKKFLKS
jgi:hypothetical protein